jgi:hypothetical protein
MNNNNYNNKTLNNNNKTQTFALYMKILHFNHSSSDSNLDTPDLAISDPHEIANCSILGGALHSHSQFRIPAFKLEFEMLRKEQIEQFREDTLLKNGVFSWGLSTITYEQVGKKVLPHLTFNLFRFLNP